MKKTITGPKPALVPQYVLGIWGQLTVDSSTVSSHLSSTGVEQYSDGADNPDGALEGTRDGILEGSALGLSLGSTNGEALGSDEGIILGSTDGEVLGSTLGTAD